MPRAFTVGDIAAELVDVIEKRVELVELALGDRVKLVVVAACAAHGKPQKRRADSGDAVDDGFDDSASAADYFALLNDGQ